LTTEIQLGPVGSDPLYPGGAFQSGMLVTPVTGVGVLGVTS
jgi:hypothetical protein